MLMCVMTVVLIVLCLVLVAFVRLLVLVVLLRCHTASKEATCLGPAVCISLCRMLLLCRVVSLVKCCRNVPGGRQCRARDSKWCDGAYLNLCIDRLRALAVSNGNKAEAEHSKEQLRTRHLVDCQRDAEASVETM